MRASAILKATDIKSTMDWYQSAGFEIADVFPEEDPTWCEVSRDGTVLQFLSGETPWTGPTAMTGTLYVHVADVGRVHDDISGRIDIPWGIEEREWDRRELVVIDPNGYFVTFTSG